MTYCAQCGYALREGTILCPSCGAKVQADTSPKAKETIKEETVSDVLVSAENTVTSSAVPIPIPEPETEKDEAPIKTGYGDNTVPTGKYALVSTGGYLLNQLVFMIPVLGLVAAIIMACAARKVNRRRHALSAVILHLLFILLIAGIVGISAIFGSTAVVAAITEWLRSLLL